MRWRLALLALVSCAALAVVDCASNTPGACSPGINECLSRCPQGGHADVHEQPPVHTQNTETPCEAACRSQYCR